MSRRIFFTFLSILVSLPFLVLIPTLVRGQTNGVYGVSGYVYDDLNANGRYDAGEPGVPNAVIYADNTQSGYRAYTDAYGHWQIPVLPPGAHSIEIQNAGAAGSRPTTSEKFLVSGPTSAVSFGMQNKGYDVAGTVRDEFGRPVSGATVYVDLPNRQTAVTDNFGNYNIKDIGYDASASQYGVSGGHNVYVEGYSGNPVLVNPQYATATLPANVTVVTNQGGVNCGPTYAKDSNSGSCGYFNDRCALPAGWQPVSSCYGTTPPGGQCTSGQRVPGSGTATCNYQTQQRCMVYSYYNSSSCSSTYQGSLEECQYVAGFCGYQSGGTGGQCTPGQPVGSSHVGCNGQLYCTNVTTRYTGNSCNTYEDYQSCGYRAGQCGYTCSPGYQCLAGSTSSDGFSTLQGEQSGFQDISVPAPVYYDTPATPIDYSWSVQPSQPSYSAPYDGGWYDQRTPYIAPDWY